MEPDDCFAPDFQERPYWWDLAAPVPVTAERRLDSADVVIVGSGYTGLAAALVLLRAGRSVAIFDADDAGFGASRRNAGYLGRTLKKSFSWLMEHYGEAHALRVYREMDEALQAVRTLITSEGIDCYLSKCGRFVTATSPAHYDDLAREFDLMKRHLGFDYHMVPRHEQRREIASDVYFGGAVIPDLGSLHPGLYHKGLLDRVIQAGGLVYSRTPVEAIEAPSGRGRFRLRTAAGDLSARDVIVATNGYTPRHLRWHARRVIPFSGYMAATDEIPAPLLAKLIPNGRTVIDSNTNVTYIRPAPDSSRLLFGGLTGSRTPSLRAMAVRLRGVLGAILPEIAGVRLSRVWTGQCAGTFDFLPHIGSADGIWYAMGYNFAGVPMGTHLGTKLAYRILGSPEGRSVFDGTGFPTAPFYRGNPWFVPAAMRYFDWKDRRFARKGSGGRH